MKARVAVLKTTPQTVVEDYGRLMRMAGYDQVLDRNRDTLIKINISWHRYFPACSTAPWQYDGVVTALLADGYRRERIIPAHNRTVVVNAKYIPPSTVGPSSGNPLTQQQLSTMIRQQACKVHEVDAISIATKLGNPLVVNTILLGALSALPETPVKRESFEMAIAGRFKDKYVKINLQAFQLGRENVNLG